MYKITEEEVLKMDHKKMLEDFKRRFKISLIITVPILMLSPMIQSFFGFT
mgnify:CR=1 FL=1